MADTSTDKMYGVLDGNPVVWIEAVEAWELIHGTWQKIDSADAVMNAKPVAQDEFEREFPHIQDLPSTAFQDV